MTIHWEGYTPQEGPQEKYVDADPADSFRFNCPRKPMNTMKNIYKYKIEFGVDTLSLPKGFEILTARYQNSGYGEGLKLWVLVDLANNTERVTFTTVPKGATLIDATKYIATVEAPDGEIFHVFQLL